MYIIKLASGGLGPAYEVAISSQLSRPVSLGSQCEMATHTCLKHDVLVFISHMITGAMHTVFSF